MTVSAQVMKIRFPEFLNVQDAGIEFAIEEAALFMSKYTGPGYDLAQMYLAAHILAVNQNTADSGGRDTISETIGRLSETFRGPPTGAAVTVGDLSTTSYGKRYQQIINLNTPRFAVVHERRHGWPGWW